jgi:mono/diheme cytochrome c family protein
MASGLRVACRLGTVLLLGTVAYPGVNRADVIARPDSALATNQCAPGPDLRGDPDRGAPLHLRYCAGCHGGDGNPEGIAMALEVPPGNQSDPGRMRALTDAELYLAICKGGEGVGKNPNMPAWGDVLTEQDIRDLIAQVRGFSGS